MTEKKIRFKVILVIQDSKRGQKWEGQETSPLWSHFCILFNQIS